MRHLAFLLTTALALSAVLIGGACAHQPAWRCQLTARPGEFELLILPKAVVTSRLRGTMHPLVGEGWLAQNEPAIEITAHATGAVVKVVKADVDGKIPMTDLPPGRYCYRATASGFSSVAGRLEVKANAPMRNIDVRLPLAN